MRRFTIALFLLVLLWLGSFLWFATCLPTARAPADASSDAIIVLTGGPGRVEQGLAVLADGAAPLLLISGVGHNVTLSQMIGAHASPALQQRIAARQAQIVLDYVASTTRSNASEAAAFARANAVHSVRLVTAYYHMPRSLLEFRATMPDATILPDPVFPAGAERMPWWQDEATRWLVFSEYHKYIAALCLQLLGVFR